MGRNPTAAFFGPPLRRRDFVRIPAIGVELRKRVVSGDGLAVGASSLATRRVRVASKLAPTKFIRGDPA